MEVELHDKQEAPFDDTTSKIVLCISGKRSGKTVVGALKLISCITTNISNDIHGDYLISGPTYRILRNATLPTLFTYWPQKLGVYKKSDSVIDLVDGHKVFIVSTEDPDKLEGFGAISAWVDEIGQISREAFDKIWMRTTPVAGRKRGQIIGTSTPYGTPSSFINKDLILQRDKLGYIGYYTWKTTDNPHIATEDVATAKGLIDERIFKRDYEGQYTNIVGLIYPEFDRAVDVIKPIEIPAHWPKFIGIDYGFSDPTSMVVIAKNIDNLEDEEYYVIDSYYESKGSLESFASFLDRYKDVKEVCYDPSAVGIMTELQKRTRLNFTAADNTVNVGIARLTSLFKKHKIKIFNNNDAVIEDLESYIYEENRDKPKHANSHGPDSLRYCFMGRVFTARKKSITSTEASAVLAREREKLNPFDQWSTTKKYHPGQRRDDKDGIVYVPIEWND